MRYLRRCGGPAAVAPRALLLLSLVVVLAAAVLAFAACITTPPADLPAINEPRPTILHDSVVPPADLILPVWPSMFEVPVDVGDPNYPLAYNVFDDYFPGGGVLGTSGPLVSQTELPPVAVEAGIQVISFSLDAPDPAFCHRVEFEVARGFTALSMHTPTSTGGDSVTWFYNPGGDPGGCPTYDAGAFQDGAFPPADGPMDVGLAVVPTGDP